MVPKIASKKQVHDEEEIHLVLEGVVYVHDERALDHREQFQLVHDTWDALFSNDACLSHLLHGIFVVFVLFGLHTPHFAETSTTDCIDLLEVCLANQRCAFLVF